MADILEKVRDVAEGQIDFEGQRFSEFLTAVLLTIIAGASFGVGYLFQDIKLALFIALGGFALASLVIVPAWPIFNRNPVRWLTAGDGATPYPKIEIDGQLVG